MNINLVPYTWVRHFTVAIVGSAAVVVAWWLLLVWAVEVGPSIGLLWASWAEILVYFALFSFVIGFVTVFTEGALEKNSVTGRWLSSLISGVLSAIMVTIGVSIFRFGLPFVLPDSLSILVSDPSFVSLRFGLLYWVVAGVGTSLGPLAVHRGKGAAAHLFSGLTAGLLASAIWHLCAYNIFQDLFAASLAGPMVWVFAFSSLYRGVPDSLYTGWIRVLTGPRAGRRIPIDSPHHASSERFVGHYPRGLDLHLGAEIGVSELHASFVKKSNGHYTVRGLSQASTVLKRPLESIELRYDVRKPAPLEAELQMEDRLLLSGNKQTTEIEFILLPRES